MIQRYHRIPSFVETRLIDLHGNEHFFVDKLPIFYMGDDIEESELPAESVIRCKIIHSDGIEVSIDISVPDDVISLDGKSVFCVSLKQMVNNL